MSVCVERGEMGEMEIERKGGREKTVPRLIVLVFFPP
jgi:hypothetical protein